MYAYPYVYVRVCVCQFTYLFACQSISLFAVSVTTETGKMPLIITACIKLSPNR